MNKHKNAGTEIDMVILATGYREECVVQSKDRLNGLYKSVDLARSNCFFC